MSTSDIAPETGDGLSLTLDSVSAADHPAIARAVEEILSNRTSGSMFSSHVSHASATE